MIKTAIEFFRASPTMRLFATAGTIMVFTGMLGVHVITQALEHSTLGNPNFAERRPSDGAPQSRLVTRSVLDDNIVTGSIKDQAARTRLDPCAQAAPKQ